MTIVVIFTDIENSRSIWTLGATRDAKKRFILYNFEAVFLVFLAAIAKAIAVEIVWVCCCHHRRRRRHHHRRCCCRRCCWFRSRISSVFYSITLCLLFIYFFLLSSVRLGEPEVGAGAMWMCACVKFLISFYAFFVCAVWLPLSLLPVLILYERCFSYSTSMVFFLFFLVIFFYCVFRLSGKSRSVLCCVLLFFFCSFSLFGCSHIYLFFFSSSALNFVWFSSVSVCVCIVYSLLLLLLLLVVEMLLYRLFYFILFFFPSYFFSSEAFHVEYVNGFIHIYFSQFFFHFFCRCCVFRFFFRSFPACISIW